MNIYLFCKQSLSLPTSTPSSVAMNPRTEKMAKPAVKEVMQLPMHTIIVSLKMLLWNLRSRW